MNSLMCNKSGLLVEIFHICHIFVVFPILNSMTQSSDDFLVKAFPHLEDSSSYGLWCEVSHSESRLPAEDFYSLPTFFPTCFWCEFSDAQWVLSSSYSLLTSVCSMSHSVCSGSIPKGIIVFSTLVNSWMGSKVWLLEEGFSTVSVYVRSFPLVISSILSGAHNSLKFLCYLHA